MSKETLLLAYQDLQRAILINLLCDIEAYQKANRRGDEYAWKYFLEASKAAHLLRLTLPDKKFNPVRRKLMIDSFRSKLAELKNRGAK